MATDGLPITPGTESTVNPLVVPKADANPGQLFAQQVQPHIEKVVGETSPNQPAPGTSTPSAE